MTLQSSIKSVCLLLLNNTIHNFTTFSTACPVSLALWIGTPTNFCTVIGTFPFFNNSLWIWSLLFTNFYPILLLILQLGVQIACLAAFQTSSTLLPLTATTCLIPRKWSIMSSSSKPCSKPPRVDATAIGLDLNIAITTTPSVQQLINLSSHVTRPITQLPIVPDFPIQDGFSAVPVTKEAELRLVGGRLSSYFSFWPSSLQQSLSPWLINIIHYGCRVPLVSSPLLARLSLRPQQLQHPQLTISVMDEINTLLHKQAIEPAPLNTAGFHSQLFVIPKKGEGLRPVLNLRNLHRCLPP